VIKLQEGLNAKSREIFSTMEKITARKIYRSDFTCFLTTFPRFPYNYQKGYIWLSCKRGLDYQIQIFMHELLHFQFFEYYGEKAWNCLGREKYQYLKEAMTIILDDEMQHIASVKDKGYELYAKLGRKLLRIWRQTKQFDKFIELSIRAAKEFSI